MTRIWLLSLFTGGALLLAAYAQSQQEEEATGETPAVVQQQQPEPAPAPTSERNDESPYDYQASEEISEDLSVSFPVDI